MSKDAQGIVLLGIGLFWLYGIFAGALYWPTFKRSTKKLLSVLLAVTTPALLYALWNF